MPSPARAGASKDGHLPFASGASALLQSRDESKAVDGLTEALVKTLNRSRTSRRAHPRERGGGGRCRVPGLCARRAGRDRRSSAWDYLADGDGGRLVLLLRLAGVSREFAARLLALLGDLVGIGDLGTEIGRFDALGRSAGPIGQRMAAARSWLSCGTQDIGRRRWRPLLLIAGPSAAAWTVRTG